jgi:hypothetical protein
MEGRCRGRRFCVQARSSDPAAKKLALGELGDIDEVPQGTTKAGATK